MLGFAVRTRPARRAATPMRCAMAAIAASVWPAEHEIDKSDVTGLALGHARRRQSLGCSQGQPRRRDRRLVPSKLCSPAPGHGEPGIGDDGLWSQASAAPGRTSAPGWSRPDVGILRAAVAWSSRLSVVGQHGGELPTGRSRLPSARGGPRDEVCRCLRHARC